MAVDLMAYIGGRASWELDLYDDIADAMKIVADEHNVKIRWVPMAYSDLREWDSSNARCNE